MTTIPAIWSHLYVWRGLPVPYVACWSAEQTGQHYELERWLGLDWLSTAMPFLGHPDFGSTNSERQREGMRWGKCQICGRKRADVWVIPNVGGWMGSHVDIWQRLGLVVNPPVHRECYEASRLICPHLSTVEPFVVLDDIDEARPEAAQGRIDNEDGYMMLDEARRVRGFVGRQLIVSLWRDGEQVRA